MTRLSDTQATILSKASQREDGNVLPLPGSLRGGSAKKVIAALLSRGLIREEVTTNPAIADPALNTFWRNDADGNATLLRITDAGLAALGLDTGADGATGGDEAQSPGKGPAGETATTGAHSAAPRKGTKQARLIDMLKAEGGATIAEIADATGWQHHTVRGAISGGLKKRLGLAVISEKVEGRGRVYRITG